MDAWCEEQVDLVDLRSQVHLAAVVVDSLEARCADEAPGSSQYEELTEALEFWRGFYKQLWQELLELQAEAQKASCAPRLEVVKSDLDSTLSPTASAARTGTAQ